LVALSIGDLQKDHHFMFFLDNFDPTDFLELVKTVQCQ